VNVTPYFQDDFVTIYHGDCRNILPHLDPVDLVLTDPPYGIGVTRMKLGDRAVKPLYRGSTQWDDKTPDISMLLDVAPHIIIWGGNFFPLPISRCWLVWDKMNGGTDFADCELAWTNRDAPIRIKRHSWNGANAKELKDWDRFHPTQKPVGLMQWCMQFYPKAMSVLDPFMGSGTTLRAAKDLGRKAIGIEIDEKYCEIAAKCHRWQWI